MEFFRRNPNVPVGIRGVRTICRNDFGFYEYRALILILTFLAYACFHASRKPLSIVKGVLHQDVINPGSSDSFGAPAPAPTSKIGWKPFDGIDGEARLGEIDVAFLASYAVGMYFAGRLGDRLDLRKFLTSGMVSSGAFVCFFGMGYWWNIHSFSYYFAVQVVTGLLSSTGWPAVVAIVANWCGKTERGLVMGIWNAHTSVGNIAGSVVAAAVIQYGWGWSFVFPGFAIMICGLLVFLFLVVEPAHVGLPSPYELDESRDGDQWTLDTHPEERKTLLANSQNVVIAGDENDSPSPETLEMPLSSDVSWEVIGSPEEKLEESRILEGHKVEPLADGHDLTPIGFFEAWCIPGVALFAFCLFFVKLVAYTFLFWLPFYLKHTEIAGEHLSDNMAGYLSTFFDIGGVLGGIMAGHLSDKYHVKAIIAAILVSCTIPSLYLFRVYGGVSVAHASSLMILSGIFVNGPYALITTAVSADLGTHSSLKGNARALATVTAIIDGTGSVGAAVGPFLTGYIASKSWTAVFTMLALASLVAGLLLTKLVLAEIKEITEKLHSRSGTEANIGGQEELREL